MDAPSKLNANNVNSSMRNSIRSPLPEKQRGVFTPNHLFAAGFKYTGEKDAARCKECGLEISDWTKDMNPYKMHMHQKPDCPFIQAIIKSSSNKSVSSLSTTTVRNTSTQSEHNNSSESQEIETLESEPLLNSLLETDLLQQVRRRTFSHWPHRTLPSSAQMIEAGFFQCNVGDRVICIYCNLICQQWTPNIDDPCEVHKTLSPHCIYVKAKLIRPSASSIITVNENSSGATSSNLPTTLANPESLRSNEIVFTATYDPFYAELSERRASFVTWPNENLSSVDDFAQAGFFYTGTKTIVTCFYCNGSLQSLEPNDNPMVEHARWFPHCAYAKQLCGDEMYRKIQEDQRAQQELIKANDAEKQANTSTAANANTNANNQQLLIPDKNKLFGFVAARLYLPVSRRLLDQNFKLSIVKRCWEDQLNLKRNDFASDGDLYIACLILQKQIERIDGKKGNIIIPSIKMKQIQEQNGECATEQSPTAVNTTQSKPNIADDSTSASPNNPCVLCLTNEKQLACIPCGHFAMCAPCGHSLRSCPICLREIEAFVRVYL